MPQETVFITIGAIATIATTTTAVVNWLHSKFRRQELIDTQFTEKLEHLTYLDHANRELIDHRTKRFEEGISRVENALSATIDKNEITVKSEIESLKSRLRHIENFLAKTTEFSTRN
ncbi:MAG: hypothetical protein AAGA75_07590 [Cyanobacteria bacterium P01_E01_bin.6]